MLKVADAFYEDQRIVLVLADGGRIEVPATRIDRVVADEVATDPEPIPVRPTCKWGWADQALPAATPYAKAITKAARNAGIHPWLLAVLVQTESAFDARAISRAGACGLTQLMPAAAQDHGVTDVWDPEENLRGGAQHLRRLLDRFGTLTLALAAYNAGAATVQRAQGVPPYRETREFVRRILAVFCPQEPPPGRVTAEI